MKQRVQQHALVELAHVVVFVSPASVEAPGAPAASFARWPATGRTRAPGRAAARSEHSRLGGFTHRQLILGELVLARLLRRGAPVMMTVMMMVVVQTIAGVQLALLVRLRMVPCGIDQDEIC